MKYQRFIILFLFALSCTFTFAQTPSTDIDKTDKDSCIKLTKELIFSLQLNENEYIKLKTLNISYLSKVVQTNTYVQLNASDTTNPFEDLEAQHEHELLSFLSPHQLHAYQQYKQSNVSVLQQLAAIVYETNRMKELIANTQNP